MKHKVFLLLALFTASFNGSALSVADADSLSARAARAYASGDAAKALALYDSVATHYTSATLFYNMGNCHYRTGDMAMAVLNYERAHRLAPGNEDILANLELTRSQLKDRIGELPSFSLGSWWEAFRGGADPDQWARRSLWWCAAFFALLGMSLYIRGAGKRKGVLVASVTTLVGVFISLFMAYGRHTDLNDRSSAIIMEAKVDVRSTPSAKGPVLFMLHKGTKVKLLQQQEGWQEVRLTNGSVGWMPEGALERI
ncbi:MAG: SH3 domain-containing protein [Flavobacteriales bacterium]|nr:SH3 domain-containing protein [Flavobacteriales bacterium]